MMPIGCGCLFGADLVALPAGDCQRGKKVFRNGKLMCVPLHMCDKRAEAPPTERNCGCILWANGKMLKRLSLFAFSQRKYSYKFSARQRRVEKYY